MAPCTCFHSACCTWWKDWRLAPCYLGPPKEVDAVAEGYARVYHNRTFASPFVRLLRESLFLRGGSRAGGLARPQSPKLAQLSKGGLDPVARLQETNSLDRLQAEDWRRQPKLVSAVHGRHRYRRLGHLIILRERTAVAIKRKAFVTGKAWWIRGSSPMEVSA